MKEEKINIPEELQEVCRDIAKVAQKHGLRRLSGQFSHRTAWGGNISFVWDSGRHNAESNELSISTQFFVSTKVNLIEP